MGLRPCERKYRSAMSDAPIATQSKLVRKLVGFAATSGAPGEIRTPNLLIRSQMLYPLSYGRPPSAVGVQRGV